MNQYFTRLTPFRFILYFILSLVLSVVLTVPFIAGSAAAFANPALIVFLSSLGLYLGILLLIWGLGLTREDRRRISRPAPARSQRHPLFVIAPFLLSLPINILYVLFLERFFPNFLERMMEAGNLPTNFLGSPDPVSLLMLFLAVVIMAPVVEEIAFRGVFYNLLNKAMPLWAAALISSIVFGLLHGTTFLQTAVIGFVLAFIYQVTGDLKMAILGHALNNAIAFGQAVLLSRGILTEGARSEMVLSILFVAGGVFMIIASFIYLHRNPLREVFNDRSPVYKHEIWEKYSGTAIAPETPDQF